jgi:hypothetical protein
VRLGGKVAASAAFITGQVLFVDGGMSVGI